TRRPVYLLRELELWLQAGAPDREVWQTQRDAALRGEGYQTSSTAGEMRPVAASRRLVSRDLSDDRDRKAIADKEERKTAWLDGGEMSSPGTRPKTQNATSQR